MTTDTKALTVTRHLPVKLDEYRQRALTHEMVTARMEEIRIADHLKNVSDSLKASIKEHQKKQTIVAVALHNGYEMLPVICRKEIALDTNTVNIIRDDTGEIVETRALEPVEREKLRKPQK